MVNKLLLVEWLDSVQPSPGWAFLSDCDDVEPVQCRSVGWVVGQTRTAIMLAPNVGNFDGEDPQGSGFIRIPMRAVTVLTDLTSSCGDPCSHPD